MSEEPDEATIAHLSLVTKTLKEENSELRHHNERIVTLERELIIMVREYERILGRLEKVYEKHPQWQKYSSRRRPTAALLRQKHAASTKEKNLLVKDLEKELGK